MNKLRRKLLKLSIFKFLLILIPSKSFALNMKKNKFHTYKKKELKGFVWYLANTDK
tara:strand:+ start:361 stop:528 length:168 start_codon:yes stop_codon:yes gene_type:complete